MFPSRARAIVVCWAVAFAFTGSARAQPAPTPDPRTNARPVVNSLTKTPIVIPLKKLDHNTTAKTLAKTYLGKAVVVSLEAEQALLVHADEKTTREIVRWLEKFGEQAPKSPSVIALNEGRDPRELAQQLRKLAFTSATIEPLPEETALLVYGDVASVTLLRKWLGDDCADPTSSSASPAAPKPKTFAFDMKDAAWADVFAWYAEQTGLAHLAGVRPSGSFTHVLKKGERFTLGEITDAINGALAQQKLLLFRRAKSFEIVKADEKIDPRLVPVLDFKDLRAHGRTELAEVAIRLDDDLDGAEEELRKLLTPRGAIVIAKGRWLIVRDTVDNIARIAKTLEPITNHTDNQKTRGTPAPMETIPAPKKWGTIRFSGKIGSDETARLLHKLLPPDTVILAVPGENALLVHVTDREAKAIRAMLSPLVLPDEPEQAPAPRPVPARFLFQFWDAKWDDVFSAYAKLSGTKLISAPKPKGTFTFKPAQPEQRFTLAEITDIINDELLAQKHLLVRRHTTFHVFSADEKIDPAIVPRVVLAELSERGRTELIQAVFPIEGLVAEDVIDELQLKQLLGSFGRVTTLGGKINAVFVQDTAGNVVKIQKKIDEYHSRQ